jgi:cytochrome P450
MITDLVKLHNGKKIEKGTLVGFAPLPMSDPKFFENPEKFDAFRLATKRQKAGQENKWQFSTTSPEHIGIGHGLHACPDRFFSRQQAQNRSGASAVEI